MSWAEVVLGALAALGVVSLFRGLQRLLGASQAPAGPDAPDEPTHAAVGAARAVVLELHGGELDEVRDAVASDSPEDELAAMLNRSPPPHVLDEDGS